MKGLPKCDEDDLENDSLDDEDAELEEEAHLFVPIHEQIMQGDKRRYEEAEKARIESYVQEFLHDKYIL